MIEKLQQLAAAIKDEVADIEQQLMKPEVAQDAVRSAELRATVQAVRRYAILLGGIVEAEADEWVAFNRELS